MAVVSEDSFYILKFDRDAYTSKLEEGVEITDEGVEEAFDVVAEISDRCIMLCGGVSFPANRVFFISVKTAKWIGDCFIYTTGGNRLNYFVGNESYTISPSDTCVHA